MENTIGSNNNGRISFFDRDFVTLFIVFKLVVIVALAVFYFYLDEFQGLNLWNRIYRGEAPPASFLIPFANWDGQHYLILADSGYNTVEASRAFFPLFPILIRLTNLFFRNFYLSAFVLNLFLSYTLSWIFYQYGTYHIGKKSTGLALISFLCFPTAFFMTVFYSETLFLLLLLGFLYFYEIKKNYWSLVFAVLLPLTRAQAGFVAVALFVFVIYKLIKKEKVNLKYEALNLSAFVLGSILYLVFFYLATDSPFSGIEAQSLYLFNNSFINIFKPWRFLQSLFTPSTEWFTYNNAIIDKIFIVVIFLCLLVIIKAKNPLWLIFYLFLIYPPASMGQGGAFTRYSLIVIPFLALATWKVYPRREKLILALSVCLLFVQLVFILRFAVNGWVG